MPLRDHFQPPVSRTHSWRSVHGAWAVTIARHLNQGVLPTGFYAVPFVDHPGPVQIDVGALRIDANSGHSRWQPTSPTLTLPVTLTPTDAMGVEVRSHDGDPELAAAIELVSPRNKDRPSARTAFVNKCAERLREGCGLVIVDVVTTRQADLHAELLTTFGQTPVAESGLQANAYRLIATRDDQGSLEVWPMRLALGEVLPTLPLWLRGEQPVPLNLEASYLAACADLAIPVA